MLTIARIPDLTIPVSSYEIPCGFDVLRAVTVMRIGVELNQSFLDADMAANDREIRLEVFEPADEVDGRPTIATARRRTL